MFKKTAIATSLFGILSLSSSFANASLITHYDIDFSSPTHTVGSNPSVGTDSNQVSRATSGRTVVSSTFAGETNQSLHFKPALSTGSTIRLNMGQGYDNYQFSFDFVSSNLVNSDYAFTLLADTPHVRNFSFHGSVGMYYWGGSYNRISLGDFLDNSIYHVTLDYDLAESQVSILLNDVLQGTTFFDTTGEDIESFRFALSPWIGNAEYDPYVGVNIDNVLVTSRIDSTTAVPEPSTMLLMFLGLAGLATARRTVS